MCTFRTAATEAAKLVALPCHLEQACPARCAAGATCRRAPQRPSATGSARLTVEHHSTKMTVLWWQGGAELRLAAWDQSSSQR